MAETEVAPLVSKPQEVELGLEEEEESKSLPPPPPSSNPSSSDDADHSDVNGENLDLDLKKLGLEEENENNTVVVVKEKEKTDHHQFPQRVGEPDCAYFLRYGTCRYGLNCRYNHPSSSSSSISRNHQDRSSSTKSPESDEFALEEGGEEKEKKGNQERPGQVECKYYDRPGGCKYGKACRFQHPQEERTFVGPPLDLNFLGLPIRPGEKECVFYMRNGSCKFANNCRFHHPAPTDPGGLDPRFRNDGSLQLYSSGLSQPTVTSWTLPKSSNEMVPFLDASPSYGSVVPSPSYGSVVPPPSYGSVVPSPSSSVVPSPSYGSVVPPPSYGSVVPSPSYGSVVPPPSYGSVVPPPQGVHQTLEWNRYMAPVNPLYSPLVNMSHMGLIPSGTIAKKADGFTPHQLQIPVEEFPERPGQLECQYFLKNGDCKFKSNCKFDHPKDKAPKCVLNAMGLPLRPDQIVCSYYSRYGICKFGPACKYDHPPNCGSSALGGGARNGSESLIPQSV